MTELPCVICNAPIIGRWRKTCSSECSRRLRRRKESRRRKRDILIRPEKYKLRNKLRYARKLKDKFCRTCGTNIAGTHKSRYCSECCPKYQPKLLWCCRRCGQPVPIRRLVCDRCLSPRKTGWPSYRKKARTLEERIALIERQKQSNKKHNRLVHAAYSIYCELQDKPKPLKKSPLPAPTCVVCGITLTNFRKRILCGSQLCQADRERERWVCYYSGYPLRATPRMIAAKAAGIKIGQFRDPKPDKRQRQRSPRTDRSRSRREYAVYLAMRKMNLLPKENEL
jgi:hypothetical protein